MSDCVDDCGCQDDDSPTPPADLTVYTAVDLTDPSDCGGPK